jgi:hypothetical protein
MSAWPHIYIMREVAEKHGMTLAELRAKDKIPERSAARIEAAKRLAAERGLDATVIGRLLGGRTVWTIKYMIRDEWRERRKERCAERGRAKRRLGVEASP